ncbi:glutamate--tRNA ligase [Candidatus Bodocaedibacter vickermanii]|uniref:Glutamate--tRNA ligase n=1 Tax=Candidatus Bodocaedibacter vickermanii TaxID=2741701 RepID=A0A7L9RUF6_9PROT|nr:Glutamate--tRNA ligase 1 [Candidatus Paracaedibacteraceae bacterium 'Lake Konstanz']
MSVVVRFAPSPTGFIHVGNLRAALLNYLFALKHQGRFMLRIDDTDLERSESRFEAAIKQDLQWLGLTYNVTFNQSHRFDRYVQAAEYLKAAGRLYPCYETQEELDFLRKRQLSQGKPPIYNRQALALTDVEKSKFETEGRKPHWRFKLVEDETSWDDMIRGRVTFQGLFASDPVLIREDGVPLYTLPSVVDDMDYGVTHIIRGEDHVTNTAVQIQLLKALKGLEGIKRDHMDYAHFSLIVDASGEGFSKRTGSLSIGSLREEGIEPMAIHSLLAKLGTSEPMEPRHSLKELSDGLDFSKFSRSAPKFSVEDLHKMNAKYLHSLPFDEIAPRLQVILPEVTAEFWQVVGGNVDHLSEITYWWAVCHGTIESIVEDKSFIAQALSLLPNGGWNEDTWSTWTAALKEATGRKGKELFMPLRLALTGRPHGPEMKQFLPLMNRDGIRQRLSVGAQ